MLLKILEGVISSNYSKSSAAVEVNESFVIDWTNTETDRIYLCRCGMTFLKPLFFDGSNSFYFIGHKISGTQGSLQILNSINNDCVSMIHSCFTVLFYVAQ